MMSPVRFSISKIATLINLLLLAMLGIGSNPRAVSAYSCKGSSCTGKNPQSYGCSGDAVTKGNIYSRGILTVEIRYSKKCDAWWARVTCDGSPDPTAAVYASILQFTDGKQTGRERLVGDHAGDCHGGERTWTYMIADRDKGDRYNACWRYGPWGMNTKPTEADSCLGRH